MGESNEAKDLVEDLWENFSKTCLPSDSTLMTYHSARLCFFSGFMSLKLFSLKLVDFGHEGVSLIIDQVFDYVESVLRTEGAYEGTGVLGDDK